MSPHELLPRDLLEYVENGALLKLALLRDLSLDLLPTDFWSLCLRYLVKEFSLEFVVKYELFKDLSSLDLFL